jgi:hypothetical protein
MLLASLEPVCWQPPSTTEQASNAVFVDELNHRNIPNRCGLYAPLSMTWRARAFVMTEEKKTGAGSFSLLEKLVDVSGPATASLTGSGDYASVLATLKR